jgi:hypothetical protein
MSEVSDEHKIRGWNVINRLRLLYRSARGDPDDLKAEIIWLSVQCDYPPSCNDRLWADGFGCWMPGGSKY